MRLIYSVLDNLGNYFEFYKKEVILGAIFFFATSLSFGLGYVTHKEFNHAPIIIEKCDSVSL